jgi:hypothetical protein
MFDRSKPGEVARARTKRLAGLIGCLLVTSALVPTAATAAWTSPFDLSGTSIDVTGVNATRPAVDAGGDTVFAWRWEDGRIQTRVRAAGGTFGPIEDVTGTGTIPGSRPQVGVDTFGNAVFTWLRSDGTNIRVQARARSVTGVLSQIKNISAAGHDASNPQIAVDSAGNAVITWVRSDGTNDRAQERARSAAGALSPIENLSAAGQDAAAPQVGIDSGGNAVFTWLRSDGTDLRAQTRVRDAGGALSPIQNLTAPGQSATDPQLAVDPGGDAIFTWVRSDGTVLRAQTRARAAGGTLSQIQNLSDATAFASNPQVGVDSGGNAVFTWLQSDGTVDRVRARARSATGVLSQVENVSQAGKNASQPKVVVDSGGDAVIAWQRPDTSFIQRIQARTRSATDVLGPVENLSGVTGDAHFPQLGGNASGDAAAMWVRTDHGTFTFARAQGAFGP